MHKLRRRRRRKHDRDESDESDLSEDALSLSSSDKSSSENSENTFATESDSDYLMDSQDFEDETLAKSLRAKKDEVEGKIEAPAVPELTGDARGDEEPVLKAKDSRIASPVSMAQNLKDVSSQLFSQSPTPNFMKRNIRLAPSFDAYAADDKEKLGKGDSNKEIETLSTGITGQDIISKGKKLTECH